MKNLPVSILTKNQKKIERTSWEEDWNKYSMTVEIRYDDECWNWHNSFAITAYIKENGRDYMWWCCHDEIVKHIPHLKKYIKWHMTSSDGPWGYIANTMYYARDRDYEWVEIWDPVKWNTRFKFYKYPFTFKEHSTWFWEYLNTINEFDWIYVEEIKYDWEDTYDFWPNYSLTWFIKENENKKWYKAPFKSKREAEEFLEALKLSTYSFIEIPYEWRKAVEPNLEAARNCALWEDATLEQLNNKELLEERLPGLMKEFKSDMEELWFTY